ncbi:T9SS type A sorting domain-containing protein [Candidatus Woesearchaeota archaeon]|nr:T9SS type A sorting domain-containing protein [Candidatus Woesearchaeota archaeon]
MRQKIKQILTRKASAITFLLGMGGATLGNSETIAQECANIQNIWGKAYQANGINTIPSGQRIYIQSINREPIDTLTTFTAVDTTGWYDFDMPIGTLGNGEEISHGSTFLMIWQSPSGPRRLCTLNGCDSTRVYCNYFGRSNVKDSGIRVGIDDISLENQLLEFKANPNPFHSFTDISIELDTRKEISLEIYNILGERIYSIDKVLSQGINNIRWDGVNAKGDVVSSGIYIAKIQLDEAKGTKKFIKLR